MSMHDPRLHDIISYLSDSALTTQPATTHHHKLHCCFVRFALQFNARKFMIHTLGSHIGQAKFSSHRWVGVDNADKLDECQ